MTEADDNVVGLPDLDRLFEEVLAGEIGTDGAPAWRDDLARLVHGARAEAAPDELAAQGDIVSRMVAIRQAANAADDVEPSGVPPLTAVAATSATPTVSADLADPRTTGEPDGPYVPRHARGYRAKHAGARMQTSANPTVRYVGRLIAVKAAAVTTAVVVGTVAAAAATTGIVATVVVPAFTNEAPDSPPTGKTTTTQGDDRGGAGGADGEGDGADMTVAVPTCQLTPVCSPLTPASPGQGPAPARPTGPTVPTTEQPAATTTTTETPSTTTPTEATSTTAPDPTTTTTTETPPPTDPEPASTMSLLVPQESAAP